MTTPSSSPQPERRLESWKEIAAYLNRDARTVRRWERSEGLPVHRHRHLARSSVYAFPNELDAWRANRKPELKLPETPKLRLMSRVTAIASVVAVTVVSGGGNRWPLIGGMGAAPQVNRQVWASPPERPNSVSYDGRKISYADLSSGDVVIRDIATGVEQHFSAKLSGEPDGVAYDSLLSPDGGRIVVQWQRSNPQHASIRLIDVRSKSTTVLYDNPEVGWVTPAAWSPDGMTIALQMQLHGVGQLALLSPLDRKLVVLKTTTWSGSSGVFFSPDSARLAYDAIPAGAASRDVFVIDTNGRREVSLVSHPARDQAVGWTADGGELLFASDRSGRTALYATPTDSRPGDEPRLVKPDVGRLQKSLGVVVTGSLIYASQVSARTVRTAALDFETGKVVAPVSSPVETYLWASTEPTWSPDGKTLAFLREQPESATVIALHNPASGAVRTVNPGLQGLMGPVWVSDTAIAVLGRDSRARFGFYSVDLDSSRTTFMLSPEVLTGRTFFISPDRSTLYLLNRDAGKPTTVVAVDLNTHTQSPLGTAGSFALAPDGKSIAVIEHNRDAGTAILKTLPVSGGPAQTVLRFETGHRLLPMIRWAGIDRLVYGRWIDKRNEPTAFSISIAGGVPTEIDARIPGHPSLSIHPDGRRVAFEAGGTQFEVWALDNFGKR